MRLTLFGVKGLLLYLAIAGAFLAAPYSNVFFLLLSFLTLLGVLGVLSTLHNARGMTAEVRAAEPVPAGSAGSLSAKVHAPEGSRRTRFHIAVELELEGGALASGRAALVQGEADLVVHVPELPRGLYAVRATRVSSTYPLGLFERRHLVDGPREIVVYPAPIERAGGERSAARTPDEALSELLGRPAVADGDLQPSGLRDHREGDGLRRVHWRASARRGSLMVAEWEGAGGQGIEVQLDRRCEPEVLEEALRWISALIVLARESKQVLVLSTQGLRATYGEGHTAWSEALRFLAGARGLPADGPAPPPVSPGVARLPRAEVSRAS